MSPVVNNSNDIRTVLSAWQRNGVDEDDLPADRVVARMLRSNSVANLSQLRTGAQIEKAQRTANKQIHIVTGDQVAEHRKARVMRSHTHLPGKVLDFAHTQSWSDKEKPNLPMITLAANLGLRDDQIIGMKRAEMIDFICDKRDQKAAQIEEQDGSADAKRFAQAYKLETEIIRQSYKTKSKLDNSDNPAGTEGQRRLKRIVWALSLNLAHQQIKTSTDPELIKLSEIAVLARATALEQNDALKDPDFTNDYCADFITDHENEADQKRVRELNLKRQKAFDEFQINVDQIDLGNLPEEVENERIELFLDRLLDNRTKKTCEGFRCAIASADFRASIDKDDLMPDTLGIASQDIEEIIHSGEKSQWQIQVKIKAAARNKYDVNEDGIVQAKSGNRNFQLKPEQVQFAAVLKYHQEKQADSLSEPKQLKAKKLEMNPDVIAREKINLVENSKTGVVDLVDKLEAKYPLVAQAA